TDNVAVSQHGTTYQITFQGQFAKQSIAYIDTGTRPTKLAGTARVATRLNGIDYYDVDTLNIGLGSSDDVFNVQGTSAVTNLNTSDGNDRIYVSSNANFGQEDRPDLVTGMLAGIGGTLNIEGGSGRQTLMISDEASGVGDANALITKANGKISMDGFAPAEITYRAAETGDFGGGVTIWTGSGADKITVNGTHSRAGVNEITTLNTGLGNDVVTVNLQQGQDGAFVLNTQGPYDNLLHLQTPIFTGDYNTPADRVSVTVNGQ